MKRLFHKRRLPPRPPSGVEMAKREVRTEVVYVTCFPPGACVDWSDVDAEIERLVKS